MTAVLKRLDRTALGRAQMAEVIGRPTRMTAGSHLADLVALKKSIVLSELEARRWNAADHNYVRHPVHPRVRGCSDASGVFCDGDGILFMPRES